VTRLRRWLWQPVYWLGEFIHRGRHGWAPRDTWGLDGYLARVIGESVNHLADHTHGWPGDGSRWPLFEDWQKELHKNANDLLAYADGLYDVDPLDPEPALNRLASFWGHLWD
jgi:hypothetical protein